MDYNIDVTALCLADNNHILVGQKNGHLSCYNHNNHTALTFKKRIISMNGRNIQNIVKLSDGRYAVSAYTSGIKLFKVTLSGDYAIEEEPKVYLSGQTVGSIIEQPQKILFCCTYGGKFFKANLND
jgi:hypothetical protein